MSEKNGNTLSYRVDELEKKVKDNGDKLDEIRTNHLPHIQAELEKVKSRQVVGTGIIVAALGLSLALSQLL